MQVAKERPHLADLFALLRTAGYGLGAFSEAADVFSGLEWARPVTPWHPGLDRDLLRLVGSSTQKQCLFLHYWATHTPYGAADGRATGTTLDLLRQGQTAQVQTAYLSSVESLLEQRLAPLLESLDPAQWTVFIFGDHGETWDAHEYYHGQTLRNATLRVPLYFHVPPGHNPAVPRPVVSLLDLFPTLVRLFGLQTTYQGYAVDLWASEMPRPLLAELDPTPHLDDLAPAADPRLLTPASPLGRQWALIEPTRRYTRFCSRDDGVLQGTLTEEPIAMGPEEHAAFVRAYDEMVEKSAWGAAAPPASDPTAEEALEKRLRDLGYLA